MTPQDQIDATRCYIATFAARDDAYSPWIGSQWMAKREPLTPDVIWEAFRTRQPIGAYMLSADSTTHVAALDVDLDDGLMVCDRVARTMVAAGVPAYIEPSRRGGHLWVILDRVLPGIVVRRALRAFLEAAGVPPDPKVELRPGQDRLSSPDGLGNALRMPLMPHQATGQRSVLLSPGGRLVAEKVPEAVLELDWAKADVFGAWAERWQPALDPREIPHSYRKPRRYSDDDRTTVVEILAAIGVRAVPGRAVICPFHDDHNPSLSIARDERRVFCKSPECVASNGGRGLGTRQLRDLIAGRHAA